MKKVILCAAVAFAAVVGAFCYNNESENEMSDLARANVKVLAENVVVVIPCVPLKGKTCDFEVEDALGNRFPGSSPNMTNIKP